MCGVLTTTHGYATGLLTRRARRHRATIVLGGVLPDLPALGLAALTARRGGGGGTVDRVYSDDRTLWLHRGVHSAFAPLLLWSASPAGGRGRALARGWAGHLAVDLVTHHSDAWPMLWPLSHRRWPSPVSYWESDRHAGTLRAAELGLIACAAVLRPTRANRLAGAGAFLVAASGGVLAARVRGRPGA